jgi:hypothetical protein
MAEEITITIHKDDLGPAKREFDDDLKLVDGKGTARVKVFINNKLADAKATEESLVVKAPPRPVKVSLRPQEDMLTVVVTTKEEKIIKVIKYEYDPKEKKFRKSAGEPRDATSGSVKPHDSGSALIEAIGAAAQKIADAMAASRVRSASIVPGTPNRPPKTR